MNGISTFLHFSFDIAWSLLSGEEMWRMCMRWHLWLKYQRTWIIDSLISLRTKVGKDDGITLKHQELKTMLNFSYIIFDFFSFLKNKSCRSDILIMDFSRKLRHQRSRRWMLSCHHRTSAKRGFSRTWSIKDYSWELSSTRIFIAIIQTADKRPPCTIFST